MVVKRFTNFDVSDFNMDSEERDDEKKDESKDVIIDNLGEIGR